jgi:hypothetical protein
LFSYTTSLNQYTYNTWPDFNGPGESAEVLMSWYPPVYDLNYPDSIYFEMVGFRAYAFNFYYIVMQYGFGDTYPRNPIEIIFVSLSLIFTLFVSNFYVSEILGLVHTTNAKSSAF